MLCYAIVGRTPTFVRIVQVNFVIEILARQGRRKEDIGIGLA
jgi:hypothetical protein